MNVRSPKRIVFFGTPAFATPSLSAVADSFTLCGVVTQPDKAVGRKKVLTPPEVKQAALSYGVPILQPRTLSLQKPEGHEFLAQLKQLNADCMVVVAYGKILPEHILTLSPFGCVNVHPSLLPAFRGPTPMQAAILAGSLETGTTIMQMDAGMDTGPILAQERIKISPSVTYPELEQQLAAISTQLLVTTLHSYFNGSLTSQAQQDVTAATYCSLITREDGLVSPEMHSREVDRKFRAYAPWPGIFLLQSDIRVKILEGAFNSETGIFEPTLVQREGKNAQPYTQFCKQYPELAFRFTK